MCTSALYAQARSSAVAEERRDEFRAVRLNFAACSAYLKFASGNRYHEALLQDSLQRMKNPANPSLQLDLPDLTTFSSRAYSCLCSLTSMT